MKKSAYTIGSLIILLICAFVFVILPAFTGSSVRQAKGPVFGKYNGREIRYEQGTDFADYVSQYGQMFQSYGQQLDNSSYYYIFNYAFNATVEKMAYEEEVNKSGYKVPVSAVNRAMLPYFYDETGKYSSKLYKQTPDTTIQEIRKALEGDLIKTRFEDDNFASKKEMVGFEPLYGIKNSTAEMDFLSEYSKTVRGFNMAVFPLADYPTEEIVAYGKQNEAKFNKYDFSVITVSDKSTANTVAKRLANEEITFADAVSEYSEKNYSNTEGKLTYKYQYQIENILSNKEDMAVLADVPVDSITSIIETASGFSIFKNDSAKVAPDFTSEDTTNVVSSYLKVYENTRIEDYFSAKAKDFTSAALNDGFDAACTKYNLEKVSIEPFPLNYGGASIAKSVDTTVNGLANADTNENFLKAAFSLKMFEISAPIVMNNNVIVIQLTSEAETTDEDAAVFTQLGSYDEASAQNFVMDNPKLENNFIEAYYDNFMGN